MGVDLFVFLTEMRRHPLFRFLFLLLLFCVLILLWGVWQVRVGCDVSHPSRSSHAHTHMTRKEEGREGIWVGGRGGEKKQKKEREIILTTKRKKIKTKTTTIDYWEEKEEEEVHKALFSSPFFAALLSFSLALSPSFPPFQILLLHPPKTQQKVEKIG